MRWTHFLVSFVLAVSSQTHAADSCSLEGRNLCSIFNTSADRISYPDHTFIPNFNTFKAPAEILSAKAKANTAQNNASDDAQLNLKIQVSQILAAVSPKLSDETLFYFSDHLDILKTALNGNAFQLNIPWPPVGASHIQTVSSDDIKAQLVSLFTSTQLTDLRKLVAASADQTFQMQSRPGGSFSSQGQQLINDMNTVTPERMKHVEALFAEAKASVIAILRAGRADSELSPEEQAAITKVSAVQPNPYRRSIDKASDCLGLAPNAFYTSAHNDVSICKNMMNFPDASLIGILAHEITHSIDACNSQFGLFSVDQNALQRLKSKDDNTGDNDHYRALRLIAERTDGDYPNGFAQTAEHLNRALTAAQMSYLEDGGVIKRVSADVPFDHYVLKDVYQCLITSAGGGFQHETSADRESLVKTAVDQRQLARGSKYNAATDGATIRAALESAPECGMTDAHSKMCETMADWMGAQVLANYLKAQNTENGVTGAPVIAVKLYNACIDAGPWPQSHDPATPAEVVSAAQASKNSAQDSHAASVKRLNDIFLRNSAIRAAMGCTSNSPAAPCTHSPARASTEAVMAPQRSAPARSAQ